MCMVSAVTDNWGQRSPGLPDFRHFDTMTRSEFIAWKTQMEAELLELRTLLKAALAFDKATGQPHCETEEKVDLLRRVAKAVGLNFDDLLKEISNPPAG